MLKTVLWNFPYIRTFLSFNLIIRGKFNMRPRARSIQILKNFLPALQDMSFKVKYHYTMACNLFGAFGMHLWIYYRKPKIKKN